MASNTQLLNPIYCAVFSALICASHYGIAQVPIVQPGAPGQESKTLTKESAVEIANTSFTQADVKFMQNMIPHHAQAVEMGILVEDRTNNEAILDIAGRIKKSQADEIKFMTDWLSTRGLSTNIPHHEHMDHSLMGMASDEQMKSLELAKGIDFDRMFLSLMIPHHQGAIRMVEDLLDEPGSAYDPILYEFINDVVNDQTAEIDRMNALLANLSTDPRATLKAGFRDAEQASLNALLVHTLPKPDGFFDPQNPSNLPPPKMVEALEQLDKIKQLQSKHPHHRPQPDQISTDDLDETQNEEDNNSDENELKNDATMGGDIKTEFGERWPLLSFWNTDMAFSNNILIAGNYHGFNIYQLDSEGIPSLLSSIVCPGGQGDVSIVGELLIMSVEQTRGRLDCGLQGVSEDVSEQRFRGLRIFDISDLTRPKQVGAVQTCRGSHTHSIVSANDRKIVVYNSGTSTVRSDQELKGCIGEEVADERTALFRIDVIEIPVENPAQAKIVSSPAVFSDDEGRVAGLWLGGDHGEGTQTTRPTDECHDITVFPTLDLAAGACSGNGILLDISNPKKPKRIDEVTDDGFAYWHSATFNNDGDKVIFTDEWGGGTQPRCRPSDPKTWGANAIYSIDDGRFEFESYYKIGAVQGESENCVAHNGSIVPIPGRDIFAQAWYQGGLSIMDFTDPENPIEIAYFDRGPINEEPRVIGGYWSTYWYQGKIYGTEMIRGLDVIELLPSEFLSENELAAARMADMGQSFNPQQQFPVSWPDSPVVAMAYIDQLIRSEALPSEQIQEMIELVNKVTEHLEQDTKDRSFAREIRKYAKSLSNLDIENMNRSVQSLADLLERLAKEIR